MDCTMDDMPASDADKPIGVKDYAFLVELSKTDGASERWYFLRAGFVTMRLAREFFEYGPVQAHLRMNVAAVQRAVAECHDPVFQRALASIVETITHAPSSDPSIVAGPVMAYAKLLEQRGEWGLAEEVWQGVVDGLWPTRTLVTEEMAVALIRLASAKRKRSDYAAAQAVYEQVQHFAVKHSQYRYYVRAAVGLGIIEMERGNLGAAHEMLTAAAVEANRNGYVDVEIDALHSRGSVASAMGRQQDALIDFGLALKRNPDPGVLPHLLVNLGAVAMESGYLELAADAFAIAAHSNHAIAKAQAYVNLLELSLWLHDETSFDDVRGALDTLGDAIPLFFEAYRRLYDLRGRIIFGRVTDAERATREVGEWAQARDMHKVAHAAFEDLERLQAGRSPEPYPEAIPVPPQLTSVQTQLRARKLELV